MAATTVATTKRATMDKHKPTLTVQVGNNKFNLYNTDKNLMRSDIQSPINIDKVKPQDVGVDESFYTTLNVSSREYFSILESTVGQNFISILNNTTNSVPALHSVSLSQNRSSDI